MNIKVKLNNVEMGDFDCPFVTDINSCSINPEIGVNGCPKYEDPDADVNELRASCLCPLRKEPVMVCAAT